LLQPKDYDKVLQFIVSIQPDAGNYRKTVLDQLRDFYGYNHMTFFIADKAGNLGDPVANNINNCFLEIYKQYFYKVDIFHTVNIPSHLLRKKVVSVTDIMTYEQFVNTEYYNDFFKKQDLHYQIILPLIIDEKLLGMIGIFKPKEEGEFSHKEIMVLNNVNRHIAYNLKTALFINGIQNEQFIFKSCAYQAPLGILVLGQDLSPLYFNEEASRICMDMTACDSVQGSISLVINIILEKIINRLFDHVMVYGSYQIRIIPQIIPNSSGGIETVYIIYLNNNEKPLGKILDKINEIYSFSNREKQIIEQIYSGLSNEEIADKLFLSVHTVKTHIENIYKKMGINKRTSLFNIINEIGYTI
jgi:DNA-binding CsgD family transcriptional regulator